MPDRNQNSQKDQAREAASRGRAGLATTQTALQAGDERAASRRRTIVDTGSRNTGGGEGRGTTKPVSKRAATRPNEGGSSVTTGSRGGARRNEK